MFDLPRLLHIDHIIDGVYISGWRATLYADYNVIDMQQPGKIEH
jgi:hypothetical protein